MSVSIQMDKVPAGDYRGPSIIVHLFEDFEKLTPDQESLDRRLSGLLSEVLKSGQFRGKRLEILNLGAVTGKGLRQVLLVGLGKRSEFQSHTLRLATSAATISLLSTGIGQLASGFPDPQERHLSIYDQAQLITEGVILGSYQFNPYQTENKDRPVPLSSFMLLARNLPPGPIRDAMNWARSVASASNYARSLANHPPNVATPEFLAQEAREMAKHYPSLHCRVLEREDAIKLKMGAFLSVNDGSAANRPLKLIVLEYRGHSARPSSRRGQQERGRPGRKPRIGLVGKGITFDTGGLSLKSSAHMEEMKFDMSGAAAVLGAVRALADQNLPVDVVAMIPATENMPSATATRPGDIVRSMSGKTIEILNTDAEGRLILCDTLTYMLQQRVDAIVDFATLTGACVVALGNEASGLFTNKDSLASQLEEAGRQSGERVWRLPLWPEYHELLKSNYADMKNIGGPNGGAITAACFLQKFVGDTPWAHIDIAGTAWLSEKKPGRAAGATGVGVRLSLEFLKRYKPVS